MDEKLDSSKCPCVIYCGRYEHKEACVLIGCDLAGDYGILSGKFCDGKCPIKECKVRDGRAGLGLGKLLKALHLR